MRGVSGSGKSTYARTKIETPLILSSDDFWLLDGPDYQKNFDPKRLGEAHAWNLRRFTLYITQEDHPVNSVNLVVDNTNTTIAEIAPYYAVAHAFGFPVEIISLDTDPKVAFERNTHGVPEAAHRRQTDNFRRCTSLIPSYWNHRIVYGNS
jgi:predicted kinase